MFYDCKREEKIKTLALIESKNEECKIIEMYNFFEEYKANEIIEAAKRL